MTLDGQHRFRTTASSGLAVVCLVLGMPFSFVHLSDGSYLVAIGGIVSTLVLVTHALLMRRESPWSVVSLAIMTPLGVWFLAYLLSKFAFMGLLWCFPGILGFYCLLPERLAWVTNAVLFALMMLIGAQVLEPALLLRAAATLLSVNLFAALLLRAVIVQFAQLQKRIVTDPLTGLLNRYELVPALERRLASRRRADASSALLALDVDLFKEVNDRFGHAAGDALLKRLGERLVAGKRSTDDAFRLGGEEFLIVLQDLDTEAALVRANTLREELRDVLSLPEREVTVSIGVAMAAPDDGWSDWMSRADDALYRAKAQGRDRVMLAVTSPRRMTGHSPEQTVRRYARALESRDQAVTDALSEARTADEERAPA